MTDVFISYSRKDKAFVQVLNQALVKSKYDAWVDWESIPLTADWWEEIKAGIEAADTFIFVLTPDSVASKVCGQEIDHAVANNKRLVPIVRRDGFDMALVHPAVGKHNWLFFRKQDDFDAAFASLVKSLDTDLAYVKAHTRLLLRSLEWEKKQRRDDLLLRGTELTEAEQWLAAASQFEGDPSLTPQQQTYIQKSRQVEEASERLAAAGEKAKRLVRIGSGVLAGTVAIAIAIGVTTQRNVQRSRQFAQLEQGGINALQQFEYQEIEALLQAMTAAEGLKRLMGGGDKPLRHYAPYSPPRSLQQILDRIQQKNQFSKNPNAVSDRDITTALSPDGETLTITSSDGEVALKTLRGNDVATLQGHLGSVWHADFDSSGQRIVSASDDGTFHLWNQSGDLIDVIDFPTQKSNRIRFSPDGEYLAISGWDENEVLLLDANGNLLTSIESSRPNDIVFSPDSQMLAVASENTIVEVWNLQEQKLKITFKGHDGSVESIKFSSDGKHLASGSSDSTVRIWNLKTEKSSVISGLQGWVFGLDFHPSINQIAAGSSGSIVRIWDLDGNLIQNLAGHVGTVNSVEFSPDGMTLVTAADDGYVRVWSLEDKQKADLSSDAPNAILNADFDSPGETVATASYNGTVQIWDLEGEQIARLALPEQNVLNIVYSPDGDKIATSTLAGDIQLWTLEGELISRFRHHTSRVLGLDFSTDGQLLISGSHDRTAKLWDLDGNVLTTVEHDEDIRSVAFSPSNQSFVTASEDRVARLWDLNGALLAEFEGHADGINSISFHPDGTMLVTASDDSTVKFWDLQGNLLRSFQKHNGRVRTVEFSPDGESIATGTSDGYARLWDLEGNLLGEFKGHDEALSSVNFSPDGKHLVTTSFDGTAKLWQVAQTLDELLLLGCSWLEDYLKIHPEALTELATCRRGEILSDAAIALVTQGETMAKAGDQEGAIAAFRTAQDWNSSLKFNPRVRAQQFQIVGEAEALAQQGDLEGALETFQFALDMDPSLDLDPESEFRHRAIYALVEQGDELAELGDATAAENSFAAAVTLNPNLPLDPKLRAQQITATTLIDQVNAHISADELDQAMAKLEQVNPLALAAHTEASTWLNICFQGALNGLAAQVLSVCDRAVELAPYPSSWQARRALARALANDRDGAIADFQAYLDWANTTTLFSKEELADSVARRQAWLAALQAGENPFTPEKIEELKDGGF